MDVLSYVLMSNHYHLVVRSPDNQRFRALTSRRTPCSHLRRYPRSHYKHCVISQFMHVLKLSVSKELQRNLDLVGHLWQGQHFRRRLADARDLVVAVAYDHRNPVRAGIVARPELYERSSARAWSGDTPEADLGLRADFPFGLTCGVFRQQLLTFQNSKRLDDVMQALGKAGLRADSEPGRIYLEQLMEDAGLNPFGTSADT